MLLRTGAAVPACTKTEAWRLTAVLPVLGVLACLAGCSDEPGSPPPAPPIDGGGGAGGSGGCEPGTLATADGSCQPAGIPADGCAEGFEPADDGCEPVLPDLPCPAGQLAVPGDVSCREIAPCGDAPWGDIPVEASTQYVDESYGGGNSDGSASAPWQTIQEGIDAAEPGAIVAVAAGSYLEDLTIVDEPVRLWGRCPALVEIRGTGDGLGAIEVELAANAEIRNVALTGQGAGALSFGAEDLLLHQVWVHDVPTRAINLQPNLGPTSVTIEGSLIESAREFGVYAAGVELTVRASMVRGTRAGSGQVNGLGVLATEHEGAGTVLTLEGSLLEDNELAAVSLQGAAGSIHGSVLRSSVPLSSGEEGGGMLVEDTESGPSTVTITGSLFEHHHKAGLAIAGSELTMLHTVVRDTLPEPASQARGMALAVQEGLATAGGSRLTLRASLISHNHHVGVSLLASEGLLEQVVVRDTQPVVDGAWGLGLVASDDDEVGVPATLTIRGSIFERLRALGVLVEGSVAELDATAIRDISPQQSDQQFGRAVSVQLNQTTGLRAQLLMRDCALERSADAALVLIDSDAVVERSLLSATVPRAHDGLEGDAIVVYAQHTEATLQLTDSVLAHNARVGVASAGGHATLLGNRFECNPIDIAGEPGNSTDFIFDDLGGNRCGCDGTPVECQVKTASIQAPSPVESIEQP